MAGGPPPLLGHAPGDVVVVAVAAVVELCEHGSPLPVRVDGLPTADGDLSAARWAPVLATEPAGWRVGRALARSAAGGVGWLESWYPPPGR